MKKLKLFTLSALFIFTFSCNQDENIRMDETLNRKTETSSIIGKEYSKMNNPYENVGQNHNLFLENWSSQNPNDLNNIVNLSVDFSNQINTNINVLDYISHDEVLNSVNNSINQTFTYQIEQSHNSGKISDVVYNELLKLGNILNNTSETEDIDLLVQKIENLEKSFLLLNLNETDRSILLSVISVAKYSSNYWREEYNASLSTSGKISLPKWVSTLLNIPYVIGADSSGALAGAGMGSAIADMYNIENKATLVQTFAVAFATAASAYAATHPIF